MTAGQMHVADQPMRQQAFRSRDIPLQKRCCSLQPGSLPLEIILPFLYHHSSATRAGAGRTGLSAGSPSCRRCRTRLP